MLEGSRTSRDILQLLNLTAPPCERHCRKNDGTEASQCKPPLPVPKERLVARIGEENEPSIRLFEKLGFGITKRVAVFEEVELRYNGEDAKPWITGSRKRLL